MKIEDVLKFVPKTVESVLGYNRPRIDQLVGFSPMPVSANMTPPPPADVTPVAQPEPEKPRVPKPTPIKDKINGIKERVNNWKNYIFPQKESVTTPQTGLYLGQKEDSIAKQLIGAESFNGDEKQFVDFLKKTNPGRLTPTNDGNRYGDAGQYGWLVGFTVPTYNSIKEKAKTDKRYADLLGKLDFGTWNGAIKSGVEYMKFRNTMFDSSGNPIGTHTDNVEDAYVKRYNASGAGEAQARKNWRTHQAK